MTQVKSAQDYPENTKYLLIVLKETSFLIPGDERSRTNPGHGYPEHTESVLSSEIFAFPDSEELKKKIQQLIDARPDRNDLLLLNIASQAWIKRSVDISNI